MMLVSLYDVDIRSMHDVQTMRSRGFGSSCQKACDFQSKISSGKWFRHLGSLLVRIEFEHLVMKLRH
jgi:hypothetical protein